MKRLVIIGGGVAGLSGARAALLQAAAVCVSLEVVLLEAASVLGGKIRTEHADGVPLEWGPDSFLTMKPGARELCRELDLATDAPGPLASRAYLHLGGSLRPLPAGLAMGLPTGLRPLPGLVRSGVLGPGAALRAAMAPVWPRGRPAATLGEAARRRLGAKAAGRLVAPIVAAIFGAPADELEPTLVPALRDGRSFVRSMLRRRRSDGPAFLAVRGGMEVLVRRLADQLAAVDIRLGTSGETVVPDGQRHRVITQGEEILADAVLVATEPPVAGRLIGSPVLRTIKTTAAAVVHLAWSPGDLGHPLDAAGYVSAPEDHAVGGAATFLSAKWPHLGSAPRVRTVVTDRRALGATDPELISAVTLEVGSLLGATAQPWEVRLHRWPSGVPILSPGHRAAVAEATSSLPAGVQLAGAAAAQVGIADCVRSGSRAGFDLVASLA